MFGLFPSLLPFRFSSMCARMMALTIAGCSLFTSPAIALPGDSPRTVQRWIENHPSLPSVSSGSLRAGWSVPGRRLTFQALNILPGFYDDAPARVIRSEQIEVRDEIDSVSIEQMEQVLRALYGSDVYQDYRNAAIVYGYTRTNELDVPAAIVRDLEDGALLQGARFAYWLRVLYDDNKMPIIGQLTVLLSEDRDRLEAYLRRE